MDILANLMNGFLKLITPGNFGAVLAGTVLGTVVGVLPGLGPAATIAILLPITLGMGPTAGLIMLAGIYYGAQYGGSTTSILMRIPGEASSVMTCIDGFEMSKKGRAGAALTAAAIGSFIAGTIGFIGLTIVAVPLARFALKFGPPEFFTIALCGLIVLSNVTGKSSLRNFAMVLAGLMLSTVGSDPMLALARFTFGKTSLLNGIDYVTVMIGLFGMTEIIDWTITREGEGLRVPKVRFRELYPTREEWRRMFPPIFRGGILGFGIGLLPGPGGVISTYASYALEKRVCRRREELGHGAIEGVAGPEAANNAAVAAKLIPVLSLGLPFTAISAMLLAALMMHGITPGPMFITEHPEIFWVVVAGLYLGNLMLLIFNLPLVGVFAMVLRIPMRVLMPIIALLCIIGTYSLNNSLLDTWIMLISGVIGFWMRRLDFEAPPLILGMVFGRMMETSLNQSLLMFRGDPLKLFLRPISGTFLIVTFLALFITVFLKNRRSSKS